MANGISISSYQEWTRTMWQPSEDKVHDTNHALLGLVTEVGEIIDPFKKEWYTPNRGVEIDVKHVEEEIGDLLFYATVLADQFNLKMEDVIATNITKLENRYGNGT